MRQITTKRSRVPGKTVSGWFAAAILLLGSAGAASAQTPSDPNPGAITFTGNFDVPSVYFFRGIQQEVDPGFTMFPSGDIGIAFSKATLNFGVWNSLLTGSSGTDGPTGRLHYEEDWYTTLTLPFANGFAVGTTWTAYTSPNSMFSTVQELSFKVSKSGKYAPYGIIGFELSDAGADGGTGKGTYLELGVGPSWPLGKATLAIPVKIGMSLNNYYELNGEDNKFGFFDVGGLVTLPMSGVPSSFGSWNLHFGADYLALGETTKAFNVDSDGDPSSSQFIALVGIGVSY
ncbi:MAG TPA: hypothetical protein VJP86_14720 [Vicinamibacterales bacterium]|nr:hypothetical protein [Vicinamibacterales bacterium]